MGRNSKFARTASENDLAQADAALMFLESEDMANQPTAATSTATTSIPTASTSSSSSIPSRRAACCSSTTADTTCLPGSGLYTAATTSATTSTTTSTTTGAVSATTAAPSGPAKRAPRATPTHPPLPPELPATAREVTDVASLARVVTALATATVKAVQDGKSVTAPNKRLIILAAEETRRAMAAFERITALTTGATPTTAQPHATTTSTTPVGPSTVATSVLTDSSLKRELVACVREEFGKLKAELSQDARRAAARAPSGPTYAQMARQQTPPPQQQQQQLEQQPQRSAAPFSRPPPPPRVSRPAIVVAIKAPVSSKQEAMEAFRKSISFRESNYAPARYQTVSHNKLRVEFDTDQQRDDALLRLRDVSEVTAEPARMLKPMLILKGISKNTPSSELVDIVRRQNNCTNGELALKFERKNRNENLYSAVLVASPDVWQRLVDLGRVCVDHQRVHVEQFSPFIQCFACLQFGHVSKNCTPSAPKPCACCASAAHQEPDCPAKGDRYSFKCYNCTNRNIKFNNSDPTNHKATSGSCSVARAMRARVENRVDYGMP